MDSNIINGIIRAIGPAIVAFLVGKGIIPAGDYAAVFAGLTAIVAAVWSVKSNTTK
jgi:hypothetical protein